MARPTRSRVSSTSARRTGCSATCPRRVEAATPVTQRPLRERLWEILDVCLADRRQAWVMRPDGRFVQLLPAEGDNGVAARGTHEWFMELATPSIARA